MPFEKHFTVEYSELDENTQYRFAEIEISFAIRTLTQFFRRNTSPRHSAIRNLYLLVVPNHQQLMTEYESKFHTTLNLSSFLKPSKEELIHYFLIKGLSYQKIKTLVGTSPNTISRLRYGVPHYHPLFNMWSKDMIDAWNNAKHLFNLFDEKMIQNS